MTGINHTSPGDAVRVLPGDQPDDQPDERQCVVIETMSGFICAECGDDCQCVVCRIQD